jgi:hypothetical protein
MRNVLFVLDPLGTGKAWRSLAIAEQLHRLFPALSIHFLAGPAAAALLRSAAPFPVEDTLRPILPAPATIEREDPAEGALAEEAAAARRRLAPVHAREALRVARALAAELVVVDGLFAAPATLHRARFDVALLLDHLLDAEPRPGAFARAGAALLRRGLVAATSLRFFVGEPSYLASPELRVWSRRFFRYTGPISALARLDVRACAALRDDLGIGSRKLVVVAVGNAFASATIRPAVAAARALAAERRDVVVRVHSSPELGLEGADCGAPHELPQMLAIADAAVISGGLSLLNECAGLRVPTLALPLPGSPREARQCAYFAERFGVGTIDGTPSREGILSALRELVTQPDARRPHDAPDADEQRRNGDFVADLLADRLGRKRPGGGAVEPRGATN